MFLASLVREDSGRLRTFQPTGPRAKISIDCSAGKPNRPTGRAFFRAIERTLESMPHALGERSREATPRLRHADRIPAEITRRCANADAQTTHAFPRGARPLILRAASVSIV